MVTMYSCDYCGADIIPKKPNFSVADFDDAPTVIIKTVDLCDACEQHIFDMIKSQIDERRKLRSKT